MDAKDIDLQRVLHIYNVETLYAAGRCRRQDRPSHRCRRAHNRPGRDRAAVERVGSRAALEVIGGIAANERVGAATAPQEVPASAADERIVAALAP